jgi:hypothetical protein
MTSTNQTRTRRHARREVVDNDAFATFTRRVVRAHGRRVADGDVEALRDLIALSAVLERRFGYSGAEIANRLGITRQAAHQRWATHIPNEKAPARCDRPGGAS